MPYALLHTYCDPHSRWCFFHSAAILFTMAMGAANACTSIMAKRHMLLQNDMQRSEGDAFSDIMRDYRFLRQINFYFPLCAVLRHI